MPIARVQPERLQELDSLRGLAATAVLLNHNLYSANLLDSAPILFLWHTPFIAVVAGRPAVLFFFVLSGFVLARALARLTGPMTGRRWLAWAVQRSIRLLCPVAVSLVLSAILYYVFYRGTWPDEMWWNRSLLWREPPSIQGIAEQALLVRSLSGFDLNSVLWSLVHEWRISMILPVIAAFAALRGPQSAPLLLMTGCATAGWAVGRWGQSMDLGPGALQSIKSTCYFVLPFTIGIALDRWNATERRASVWHLAAGYLACTGLARMGSDFSDYGASAVLIWAATQPGPLRVILRWPVLTWLGRISFSLYLSHELVLMPLQHQLHDRLNNWTLCGLGCALSLPVAHVFWLLVERPTHALAQAAWRSRWHLGAAGKSIRADALPSERARS